MANTLILVSYLIFLTSIRNLDAVPVAIIGTFVTIVIAGSIYFYILSIVVRSQRLLMKENSSNKQVAYSEVATAENGTSQA